MKKSRVTFENENSRVKELIDYINKNKISSLNKLPKHMQGQYSDVIQIGILEAFHDCYNILGHCNKKETETRHISGMFNAEISYCEESEIKHITDRVRYFILRDITRPFYNDPFDSLLINEVQSMTSKRSFTDGSGVYHYEEINQWYNGEVYYYPLVDKNLLQKNGWDYICNLKEA